MLSSLRWAGLGAWLLVGAPILLGDEPQRPRAGLGWAIAFAAFGICFAAGVGRALGRRPGSPPWIPLALMTLQLGAVVAMILLLCDGFEGTLLVLIAIQLAGVVELVPGMVWIAGQSLILAAAITIHWSPGPALSLTPPYLGFQLLAFFVVRSLRGESAARRELALALGELRATQALLADGARAAERLRIARELHDALGHHLVILGLHLEAALQSAGEPALAEVRAARTLGRLLLTDLGEVVSAQRRDSCEGGEGGVDLGRALADLVREIPWPRVHLEVGGTVEVADPAVAHALLRCAQEMVTNAVKHSGAANLWLRLAGEDGVLVLAARDDGAGAPELREGNGLRGLRERLSALGGELRIAGAAPGFPVEASVPRRSAP
jgi:signal transduction histidine kinase